jgi:two-component system cell cycle sensor histidine kinase/response regulator CckA
VSALKTARVPKAFEDDFIKAEELVSRYFRDRVDDPTHGSIEIAGQRYVLVRAASLSVEFFDLVEKLYGKGGEVEARRFARNILFDLAHAIGKSDAKNFHAKMNLEDPVARLSAGPVHFSHSGWAFVDIDASSTPVPGPGYLLLYDHPYSFESDAWAQADRTVDFPVCIMNCGYSSGWCEESFDLPLVASEVLCRAKGDDCCRFIMAPPSEIESRVENYIAKEPALASRIRGYEIPDFFARKNVEEELRGARDELEIRVRERTADLRQANVRLRREMADRQRVESQLQKTQRLESLGRLAGGVAHDFNNLLGVIMGYSSILQRRVPDSDPMHGMLGEITDAAQLAANLTRQLLTFSRAQVLHTRHLDMNEVVSELLKMLKRLVGDDVRVETRLMSAVAIINADPSQIEQMLMNLAVNARDAMPNGGTITIETGFVDADGDGAPTEVMLSVSDTGTGMSADMQSKIFEPFFTTKDGGGGTGLGLSTVYGIVSQAGGNITVTSEIGKGARFDVVLPLVEGGADESPTRHSSAPHERRTETVLLVEDRIGFRALMASLLADDGYTVLVAHDTDDALRIAKQHPETIHVLVTDVVMPGMKGPELARLVREARPDTKVLYMSGFANEQALLEQSDGDDGRVTGFLRKPFTPDELDFELRRVLGE